MTPAAFSKRVLAHYNAHGRHTLPWRRTTRNPYNILVSEVMLQQTQVDRVIPYYTNWLQLFPDVHALSKAPLSNVLRAWQGLGYNRRAKMLHEAAKAVVDEHSGKMPKTVAELEALPGVGAYTARAIAAFAYNQPVVFIETNVRTAVTHHFFAEEERVRDTDILAVLERTLPKLTVTPREWYSALMDYGAFLKKSGVRINAKSTTYTKQKAFKGSGREVRGALVRALSAKPASPASLLKLFPTSRVQEVNEHLAALEREGLIERKGRVYQLPKN